MTASTGIDRAATGAEVAPCERVQLAATGQAMTTMTCRRPAQQSRRAVLHVQLPGDPAVPPRLADWYTERAFNFFVAQLRLRGRRPRRFRPALADLDAAVGYLREVEGMHDVIVTAQGGGALAAAVWSGARQHAADALILHAPALPRRGLAMSIDCPVLVLYPPAAESVRRRRRTGRPVPPAWLGGHVTWRLLPETAGWPSAAGEAGLHQLLAEVGRWLGAYMYGQLGDQLL